MKLNLGTFSRMHAQQGLDDDKLVVADAVSRWMRRLDKELPYDVDWNESPTAPFQEFEMGEATTEFMARTDHAHVKDIELWLPIEFDDPFELRLLDERVVAVGSSRRLHEWSLTQTPESVFRELVTLSRRSVDFRLPILSTTDDNA
ncbi:MAG: hypothetical protein ACYTDT_13700 [Planctomycetota bacterium]|jgi:hypothetical protein